MTGTKIEQSLGALAEKVYEADSAWYANVDDADAKAAYKAAKAAYREAERAALDKGALATCGRCGGAGGWKGWPGFTCYECGGSGRVALRTRRFQAEPPTRLKNEAAADAEANRREAAFAKAIEDLGEVGEALVEARRAVAGFDGYSDQDLPRETYFRADLASKLYRFGSLSDAQIAAVQKGLDRAKAEAEQKAAAGPLAEGRYEIEGEVVSVKWVDSQYGSTRKILVKLDCGNKVFGTSPRALDAGRGDRVTFTATVERSNDDPHFGFFSRPKA